MTVEIPSGSIMVAIDFSKHSEPTLCLAAELAAWMDAPLVVLHVVHDPADAPGYYARAVKKRQFRKIEEIAADLMTDFLRKTAKEYPRLTAIKAAHPLLVAGIPVTQILRMVDKHQVRHLLVGRQGRTGLAKWLLGSTAQKLAQFCPVPITIVKSSHSK